ncbi:MAG: hypothetical protein ACXADY_17645 [Candidatus Hodarchaeales archaeon]
MERKQGLISVFDKTGIVDFCKQASSRFTFISTGKTAKTLEESDISVKRVASHTGFPEILDGRVKTLHPIIMAGILGTINHTSEMEEMGIHPFGLVVVNLYPFQQIISQPHNLSEALENIDIGDAKYEEKVFEILTRKESLVLCVFKEYEMPQHSVRLVPNGLLVQPTDTRVITEEDLTIVSKRKPTPQEVKDLRFAWKVVKYVKSNSAVVSIGTQTLGIGMGQPSRINAVELALKHAKNRSRGAVLASDSFFPFSDSVETAGQKGITAIIAPGGSMRDSESIEAANNFNIAMVWTGIRCFRH